MHIVKDAGQWLNPFCDPTGKTEYQSEFAEVSFDGSTSEAAESPRVGKRNLFVAVAQSSI